MTFLPHASDLLILLCFLTVIAAFGALGTVLFGRNASPDQGLVAAWGLASLCLTIGGVAGIKLSWIAAGLVTLGLIAVLVLVPRGKRPSPFIPIVAALILPALVVAAGKGPSEVDEFMHWLPNAAYLVERDSFPTTATQGVSAYPAFPYNLAYIALAVSDLAGGVAEQSVVLFNVVLCGALALLLLQAGGGLSAKRRWTVTAFAVLGASALNPTFVPKIVFTNYADFATGVTLALAGWSAVTLLSTLRREQVGLPWVTAVHLGFVLAAMINLKQSNAVLVVLLVLGSLVLAAAEGRMVVARFVTLSPGWLGPALVAYFVWRSYVDRHLAGLGENKLQPLAEWQIGAIPQIIATMGDVLLKKGGYLALALMATVIGVRGLVLRRDDETTRVALLGVIVFIGYAAALLFLYVAHFPGESGRSAQSFWRYQTQLGPLLLVPAAALVGGFVARIWPRIGLRVQYGIGVALVAIVLIGPLAQAARIRFDLQPPKPQMEVIAREVGALVPPGGSLILVVPTGLGEFDRFRYRLRHAGYALRHWEGDPAVLLSRTPSGYVWLYCSPSDLGARLSLELPRDSSILLQRTENSWTITKSWPLARDDGAMRKPDGCSG